MMIAWMFLTATAVVLLATVNLARHYQVRDLQDRIAKLEERFLE